MLFKDDLYTIDSISKNENSTDYSIELNKDHSIFKGHFPGNPVTPGVAQMEIVKELVQIAKDRDVHLKTMSSCKFLAVLNPYKNAKVDVVFKFSETDDDTIKMSAVIKDDDTVYLKMSGIYA